MSVMRFGMVGVFVGCMVLGSDEEVEVEGKGGVGSESVVALSLVELGDTQHV